MVLVTDPQNGGELAAAILDQAVVLPVLLAKVAPVWAAVALAAGALLNEVAFGPMVRCGVVLPVMFVICLPTGRRGPGQTSPRPMGRHRRLRRDGGDGTGLGPRLDRSAAILSVASAVGFYCAGMLIRSRTTLVATLQRRTNELHEQRDRTAAMEVAADRARVGADLERLIRGQIQAIGVSAERAKAAANDDTDRAQAALIDVEKSGRETLARMRDVVGNLRDAPTEPPPGLDQLSDLLRRATCADARLTIEGTARPLTPTSSCRHTGSSNNADDVARSADATGGRAPSVHRRRVGDPGRRAGDHDRISPVARRSGPRAARGAGARRDARRDGA